MSFKRNPPAAPGTSTVSYGIVSAIIAASLTTSITVPPILPRMLAEFRDVPNANFLVPLVVTLPLAVSVLIAPFIGRLSDRFDRRAIVIGASLCAVIFGVAPFFLESLHHVLIARLLMGFATGTLLVCTNALIGDLFDGPGRRKMLGAKYAVLGVAHIFAFMLIGILAETGWRNAFLIFLWGLVAALLTALFIPHRPNLSETARRLADQAVVPWRRLVPIFAGVLLGAGTFDVLLTGAPFLAEELGFGGPRRAGFLAALGSTGMLIGAACFPLLAKRMSGGHLWIVIFAITAAGYVVLASAGTPLLLGIGMVVTGTGCGMVQPNSLNMLFNAVPVTARGKVAGVQTTCFFLGMALGPLIGVTLGKAISSHALLFLGGSAVMIAIAIAYLIIARATIPLPTHQPDPVGAK